MRLENYVGLSLTSGINRLVERITVYQAKTYNVLSLMLGIH